MASSTELHSLTIPISADATPAVDALKQISAESKKTKTDLDKLSKTATTVATGLKDLTSAVKNLKNVAVKEDLFGLKKSQNTVNSLTEKVNTLRKDLGAVGSDFETSMKNANASAKKLAERFQKPKQLFKVDVVTKRFLDKIDPLLDRMEKARADQRRLISEEYQVLKFRSKVMGETASVLAGNTNKFKQYIKDIDKLGAQLSKLESRFSGVANSLKKVSLHNSLVRAAKDVGTGKTNRKDAQLVRALEANTRAQNANTAASEKNTGEIHSFGRTAFYVDMGRRMATASYDSITHLQKMRARVDAWGLSDQDRLIFERQTRELQQNNPLISLADAYSMMMSASSSLGHYDPKLVGKTVNQVTKYAQMERALGYNVSDIGDIAKNYYGVAEARQVANDVQKTLDTFRTVFRITTTTAGKITVGDIETILRNMGPGAATISDEGLLRLLAYAEQIKVAGRGSAGSAGAGISTVGTNVKMLQLMAMGKPSSIHAKKMIAELGLLEDNAYIVDDKGNYQLNFEANAKNRGKAESDLVRALLGGETKLLQDTALKYIQLTQKAVEATAGVLKLERGKLGQVIETVGQGKLGTFASTGFFDKKLAQEDPVAFVESMIPLIESYTVDPKHRRDYYGNKAVGKTKDGRDIESLSAQEFLSLLSVTDLTSAMTTFWAKTGLSSRVVQALTTFSNRNFIERSTHMMETALHQKDADTIMREQIEAGNLTLATQRIQKAIDNLLQAFEPMSGVLGKAAMLLANFVDLITDFVNEYRELAAMTAGWLALKYLVSSLKMLNDTYELLSFNANKAKESTKQLANAQAQQAAASQAANAAPVVTKPNPAPAVVPQKVQPTVVASGAGQISVMNSSISATNAALEATKQKHATVVAGVWGGIKDLTKKTRSEIARLSGIIVTGLTKAFSYIGIGLLAIDFVAIGWKWIKDLEFFGKKLEEWVNGLGEKITSTDAYKDLRFNNFLYRTPEQNAERDRLLQKRAGIDRELSSVRQERKDLTDSLSEDPTAERTSWVESLVSGKPSSKAVKNREQMVSLEERENQLVKERAEVDKEIEANDKYASKTLDEADKAIAELINAMASDGGIGALAEDFAKHRKGRDEAERKVKMGEDTKSPTLDFQKEAESHQNSLSDILLKIPEALQAGDLNRLADEFDKKFATIENDKLREEIAQRLLDKSFAPIAKKMGLGDYYFEAVRRYNAKDLAEYGKDAKYGPVKTLIEALRYEAQVQGAMTPLGEKIDKNVNSENPATSLSPLPNIVGKVGFDRLTAEVNDLQNRISHAGVDINVDEFGNEFTAYSEIFKQAEDEFRQELVDGKYRDSKNTSPYQTRLLAEGEKGPALTKEDFDLNLLSDGDKGIQGWDMVALKAAAQIAEEFKRRLGSATTSIVATMRGTAYSLEDAKIALDDYAAESHQSAQMRNFDRETASQVSSLTGGIRGTPAWTDKMEADLQDLIRKREAERLQQSRLAGLQATRGYKDQARELSYSGMTRKQQLDASYQHETRLADAERQQLVRDIQESAQRNAAIADSEAEREKIYEEANSTILTLNDAYYKMALQREQNYLRERNGFNSTHLDQTIEDWQDLGSQIENLQTEMMEGFVEANEKWLDGDEQSWREYFNNLLKMWRNMALKQGYSELLGGVTKSITDNIKGFFASSFNRPNENPTNVGSTLGSSTFGQLWNMLPWAKQNASPQPTPASSVFGTVGGTAAGVAGNLWWNKPTVPTTPATNTMQAVTQTATTTGSALGTSFADQMVGNGGDLGATLAGVGETGKELESGFTSLLGSSDLLNEGQLTLQATEAAGNALQLTSNTLEQTGTVTQTSANTMLATFQLGLQSCVTALAQFYASLQASKISTTLSANGNIMTSSGPLKLRKYARGGIAREAQVSIFGEGSTPEAYVPLPDGRTIPVTLNAGNSNRQESNMNGNNVMISINVTNNSDGTSTESASDSGTSEQTSNMKKLANNIKSMVKQEIYNQSRPGGLLYNGR